MNFAAVARFLLWPFSLLYGSIVRFRAWLYEVGVFKQQRLKKPVISIGNLTLGGTGKTHYGHLAGRKIICRREVRRHS